MSESGESAESYHQNGGKGAKGLTRKKMAHMHIDAKGRVTVPARLRSGLTLFTLPVWTRLSRSGYRQSAQPYSRSDC